MSNTYNWDRIRRIHDLIKFEKTGTPLELAERLAISRSLLYLTLDQMKTMGFPLAYDFKRKSYYYTELCDFMTSRVATLRTSKGVKRLV
jgi:predicted DNA-binding transcriptional regulator YafY